MFIEKNRIEWFSQIYHAARFIMNNTIFILSSLRWFVSGTNDY